MIDETDQAGPSPRQRKIIHVDMDAFYASVEQRDNPDLRGKPVAVGGSRERGVVAAASYEARKFGVRSAMPSVTAKRECPDLIFVKPRFEVYKAVSQQIREIFDEHTLIIEPLSLDEAYLDVTENAWQEPLGMAVAKRLKVQVRETIGLTVSAGVAPNKFLAKIASGWEKPDGLTVIAPERVEQFLQQLPVDALWGVGPVTARKLRTAGFDRLVDVRNADPTVLKGLVGSFANSLRALALGHDNRAVQPHRVAKSSGSENTFAQDLTDPEAIRAEVSRMAGRAAAWLARKSLFARTVTLKVRYSDFTTITRSNSVSPPTREEADIVARAISLLERTDAGRRPVRLLGVSVHGFETTSDPAPEPENPDTRLPF